VTGVQTCALPICGLKVGLIGEPVDLTYPCQHLGAGGQTLSEIAAGAHEFCDVLKAAKRPLMIVGAGLLSRGDGGALLAKAHEIADKFDFVQSEWNGFNVLQTAASRVGGLDLGFVPGKGGRDVASILQGASEGAIKLVYLLGADEIDMAPLADAFVVYQGHHGERGAAAADVVLPGAAYTEKDATYVNLEGRPQRARQATFPLGDAQVDWRILRALSAVIGHVLPYDDLEGVRARMAEIAPQMAEIDQVATNEWRAFGDAGTVSPEPFAGSIEDFYQTNVICRASDTMAECSTIFASPAADKTGTDG